MIKAAISPGVMLLCPSLQAGTVEPRHQAVHILTSDRLVLEVMEPNDPDRYYRGVRFSPVADVLRVVMDGHDFLFSPVGHDPLQDNAGLAMEFDLFQKEFAPPGFVEAAEGQGFVKVGVGVLKKTGDIYNCATPYEVLEAARTEVAWGKDSARFQQSCVGTNGYAYVLDTDIHVAGATVTVSNCLRNTGSKLLVTENYAHNFFRFDEQGAGPGYEVLLPYDFDVTIPKPVIEKRGNSLILNSEITPKLKAAQAYVVSKELDRKSDSVTVRNTGAGMAIEALLSKPADRFTFHAAPAYVCPEQFLKISLAPGESTTWVRSYRFLSK